MTVAIQETYSSPLINKTEKFTINGVDYTKFYSERNTDLNVGDKVYILNGNYDNSDIIEQNEYQYGTNGYTVLKIDKNSIVLDIPYRSESTWNEDEFEDYTKVYLVDSLNKFNYENIDNGFGFDIFNGDKYSKLNNNVFLSKIENLPYTEETQTMNKFFKSYNFDGHELVLTNTRGQLINDDTTLKWNIEDSSSYTTGSWEMSLPSGNNFVKDFDLLQNSTNDTVFALVSSSKDSNPQLYSWYKSGTNPSTDIWYAVIYNSDFSGNPIELNAHIVKSIDTDSGLNMDNITIKMPSNLNGDFYYNSMQSLAGGPGSQTIGAGSNLTYNIVGYGNSVHLGYSDPRVDNNYRSFGFYSGKSSTNKIPNPDSNVTSYTGVVESAISYKNGYTTPYFVLSNRNGGLGNYTDSLYFPVDLQGMRFNYIPDYGEFSGIGRPVKIEINDWSNSEDGSMNLEYCFAGQGISSVYEELMGGLYFYSYAGNHLYDPNGAQENRIGNSFEISKTTFDKYQTGIWRGLDSRINPFSSISSWEDTFKLIKDIIWLGEEKKNLGLNLGINGSTVVTNTTTGIWYSKYLLVTDRGSYYVYLNYNWELLKYNPDFLNAVLTINIPQVHCVIESIPNSGNYNVIGKNRTNNSYTFPYVLDGEYTLGSKTNFGITKFPINEEFDDFTFNMMNPTSFDYNDDRWLVSSAGYSNRFLDNNNVSANGIFIYDRSVGYNIKGHNVTTNMVFDLGDNLPSNQVFKVIGEVISGKRRVWAATDMGLFFFDYDLDYNYNYYYSIDLDNKEIPLNEDLYKNDRLYIMEDFEYDGIQYRKGDVCRWISNERRWEIDYTYLKSYISKSHFKNGSFLGILDDGIFGNKKENAEWDGGVWRNGILYNAIWNSGEMQSKSDDLITQSFYAYIDKNNDKVNLTTDFTNNKEYGYNLAINSTILKGDINNGNFINCTIGDGLVPLIPSINNNYGYTYSEIDINKGYFLYSDIYSTLVSNSKVELSDFNSSKITDDSRIVNSSGNDSIIDNAIIENKGKIKVNGYEKWYNIKNNITEQDIIHVHKFYISEDDFNELNFQDSVIFNSIKINSNNPTSILDNLFYVIGGTYGYYYDVYEDLNKVIVNGNSVEYAKNPYKLFISKKLKTQNVTRSSISFNGTSLEITGVVNPNPRYSIDISIVVGTVPYGSDASEYLSMISDDQVLKFEVVDIKNATIQPNSLTNCWINGGTWLNGSIINPKQISTKFNYGTVSISNGSIKMNMYDTDYEYKSTDILNVGDNIRIDNLWHWGTVSTNLSGDYLISSFTESGGTNSITSVILDSYGTISISNGQVLNPPLNQYSFININKIDGINNELIIKGGFFKNQSFNNVTFKNDSININDTDVLFDNLRNLLIVNSEITTDNNVTIENAAFAHGQFSNNFGLSKTDIKIIGYKQVFNYVNMNGGLIKNSAFLNGSFNNGIYLDSKYNKDSDLLPINNNKYLTTRTAVVPVWHTGVFNNGLFNRSIWLNGTFNNGKFFNSEFLNGIFNNGLFGDISSKSNINLFRKGTWKNGIFDNGIFGDNSNRVTSVNSVYTSTNYILSINYYQKGGTNIWEDGNFNNGILTSTDNNVTLWYNGDFNNGQVLDSVIWYDGIFNNGKFKSTYGRNVATVWGETNLINSGSFSSLDGLRATNLKYYYNTDLSYINKYNLGTFRDIHVSGQENVFNNPGTIVLDTSDYQLKYTFINSNHTYSYDNPFSTINTSHGYGEKLISDFYDNPSTTDLSLQFRPLDYNGDLVPNPLADSSVLGAAIRVQDTGNNYIYDGSQYITESTFLSGTISGTSLTFSSIYAWRDGVFNNGEFGDPNNIGNANPSWENGTFNGGKFYGKKWKFGTFIRGNFEGSGVEQKQTSITNIYQGFNPQATIERYIDDFSILSYGTISASQSNYKNVLDRYNWYGLWLDGDVLPNINELSKPSLRVRENTLIEYFKRDNFKRRKPSESNFNKMLWVTGNFKNPDANFNQSVFLSGTFNEGRFNNSMFNPYVQRWDFENSDLTNVKFTFELDSTKAVWNNGTFNNGVFYYSDWNNGTFDYGSMVGGKFNKGTANYLSAYSTIWENGRFRNGNWYGSNFTIDNVYSVSSIPNPFEYLGEYFEGVSHPPFITDILSNNADRIQDDRLHIWNTMDGSLTFSNYDITGHDFGKDVDVITIVSEYGPFTFAGIYEDSLEDVTLTPLNGIFDLQFKVLSLYGFSSNNFNLTLTDIARFGEGVYSIDVYTLSIKKTWKKFPNLFNNRFVMYADVYTNGLLTQSNKQIFDFTTNGVKNTQVIVNKNEEYVFKITFSGTSDGNSFTDNIYVAFDKYTSQLYYTGNNNKLNGYIEPNYTGEYLNSDIATINATLSYTTIDGVTNILTYYAYDIATISVPTVYKNADGAYTQYGNGTFQYGVWESGVWNNGYRGTKFGTYIASGDELNIGTFTFSNGSTSSVSLNTLYPTQTVFKYRTSPTIYFNKIQRSFKQSKNKWRFVLESAFDIDGTSDNYNRLNIGDKISIGNIVAIDINGDRKLMDSFFTVVSIPASNRVVVEYNETFPIDDIQIDSDRHLIYVQKNIWLSGSFLNGLFEGVMNRGYVKGNREITKIEDSHLIDVEFEGGHFVGTKKSLSNTFDNRFTNALSLSPQFSQKYNLLYHSGVIQNMKFYDDVTLLSIVVNNPKDVSINGSASLNGKLITTGSTTPSNAIQYIYNSDIDVVYEPEYFSSLFDQNIYNNSVLNETKIGSTYTRIHNIPAGYITYDVLNSESKFKYSLNPDPSNIEEKEFNLSLGSKYKKYNKPFSAVYSDSPDSKIFSDSFLLDLPSTFNILQSATYGIYVSNFGTTYSSADGVTFGPEYSISVHENFMYVFGTPGENSLIKGDRNFKSRNRYHVVEVDVEFTNNKSIINPYYIQYTYTFTTSFTYSSVSLPKLTIGQSYNELYEIQGGTQGNLSPYDNDFIPFFEGQRTSEINGFTSSNRLTLKSYMYNNFGGYRNSVKVFEKDFDTPTGATSGNVTVKSPIYYSLNHYEIDKIPFFKYQDYNDPISGTVTEWNVLGDQVNTRKVDDRIKIPYYAVAVPIKLETDRYLIADKSNFLGGTNINNNSVIDQSVFVDISNPNDYVPLSDIILSDTPP